MFRKQHILLAALVAAQPALAEEVTVSASKDSFIRNGAPNTNEGSNTKLNIGKTGKRRALVEFDLTPISDALDNGRTVLSAELQLFVTNNNRKWGRNGRPIGAYPILSDWTEGNGINSRVARNENEGEPEPVPRRNNGSGSGVTWKCATDTDISNKRANCNPDWTDGGAHNPSASDTLVIRNTTTGEIALDVTTDVQTELDAVAENFGWLVRKVSQGGGGGIWVASSEASSNQPELVANIGWSFELTGAEEVPPVDTDATGNCTVTLNNAGDEATVHCTHNVQDVNAAHIHEAAIGVDGGIVCDLGPDVTSPILKVCPVDNTFRNALEAGNLYVNVHSDLHSGGEVRGQVD